MKKKVLKEIQINLFSKTKSKKISKKIFLLFPNLTPLTLKELLKYFECKDSEELYFYLDRAFPKNENENEQNLSICDCRDARGGLKDLYKEERFALKEIETTFSQKKIKLKLYRCPYESGWHLTKV